CFAGGRLDPSATDSSTPKIGSAFYYLVSGVNACGEGPIGRAPDGGWVPANGSCWLQPFSDSDGDGVADLGDDCPLVSNPGQEDGDGDTRGDLCDNCPGGLNPDQ